MLSEGGALGKMLPFFKMGLGGPVAGGRQYFPWVHLDDVVGAMLFCLDTEAASGPAERDGARARDEQGILARARARAAPARLRAGARPGGEGALRRDGGHRHHGQRAIPARLTELGYAFRRPELEDALREATGGG